MSFFLITLPHMEHISHPCCTRCIQYSDFCPLKCLVNEYDWCKWPSNRPHLLKVTTLLSTNIQKIQCQQIICTNLKKSISKDVFRKVHFQKLENFCVLNFDLIKDGGFFAVTEEMNFPNSSDVVYMWNGTLFSKNINVLKSSQIQSFFKCSKLKFQP